MFKLLLFSAFYEERVVLVHQWYKNLKLKSFSERCPHVFNSELKYKMCKIKIISFLPALKQKKNEVYILIRSEYYYQIMNKKVSPLSI